MRSCEFDLMIVGGGVLGTAVAVLASAAGWRVVCIRLSDRDRPRADSLRNQGWLQSGLMYRMKDFASEREYQAFATQTYFAGRRLLGLCGLPLGRQLGIVGTSSDERADDLRLKASLLRLSDTEFRQIGQAEARCALGHFFEEGCSYFVMPDVPFDGAAVLESLRRQASADGTKFVEVKAPVALKRSGSVVRVSVEGTEFVSPLTFIAAGSGSVPLLRQLGHDIRCSIRRTPLLVSHSTCFLPSPVYVDQDRGFSAVRHRWGEEDMATVVGTRSNLEPVVAVPPDLRSVAVAEQRRLRECLHPVLLGELEGYRVTAGEELIPADRAVTQFEPWIEDFGDVVFGSPGRATVSMLAAAKAFGRLQPKRAGNAGKLRRAGSGLAGWTDRIQMHFTPAYGFDDSERS